MAVVIGVVMLGQVACGSVCEPPVDEPEVQAEVVDSCQLPLCGPLGRTLYCIEGYESNHSATALNRRSGAAGWLQWLPSTARAWGVLIGNRQSEWSSAARIAAQGRAFFTSQWIPLQLGWC